MSLEKYLTMLKQNEVVYVAGAQRSGTTIAAKIFAKELNYNHIDENNYDVGNYQKMIALKDTLKPCVIQMPALTHRILDIAKTEDKFIIVWIMRDFYDIIKSEIRIGWHNSNWGELSEKKKYKEYFPKYFIPEIPISIIKNKVWKEVQSKQLKKSQYVNIEYNTLSKHELFVPKHKRTNFGIKQTKV